MGSVKMKTSESSLRKWDVIKHHGGGQSVIVRVNKTSANSIEYTMHPYKKYRWKLFNYIHSLYLRIKYFK